MKRALVAAARKRGPALAGGATVEQELGRLAISGTQAWPKAALLQAVGATRAVKLAPTPVAASP